MSDDIDTLPVSKMETLDPHEASRVRPFVGAFAASATTDTFLGLNKQYIWIAAAFLVLSLPFFDDLMTSMTGNKYLTLLVKAILFVVFLFVMLK